MKAFLLYYPFDVAVTKFSYITVTSITLAVVARGFFACSKFYCLTLGDLVALEGSYPLKAFQ
jgi:hypothetical protein